MRWTFEVSRIFPLDFRLGIPGQSHWENETCEHERCLCCSHSIVFPPLRYKNIFSYFNLSSLHFSKSREQTIYCNDSVLQINSSIL